MSSRKIYLASSWRNIAQAAAVQILRSIGHEVYDFRNPGPGKSGFRWTDVDPAWLEWDGNQYREALKHPVAAEGFASDFAAMEWAEMCVLLRPCGASAHLEAGWFLGKGKPVVILHLNDEEPELMYLLAGHERILTSWDEFVRYFDFERSVPF